MKIGVFSDIHGNIYSFAKALYLMEQLNIEEFFMCGDICGYYYYHNEVINLLKSINRLHCVIGNHDKMFLDIIDGKTEYEYYKNKYGSSIIKFQENITRENLDFLRNLKTDYDCQIDSITTIRMYHGNPWDHLNGYVYPDTDLTKYNEIDADYIFQGHTHYRMIKSINNLTIINPGSIGQPRDGRPACFAVLDTEEKEVEFVSVNYNIGQLIKDIDELQGEPSYLINVLRRSNNNDK